MMTIGYVGIGNMGGALARRLHLDQPIAVFDLNPKAVATFVADGATAYKSAKALAEACDVVFTCLQTSAQVRDVIFGKDGLVTGLKRGSMIVDQTTGDAIATREMAQELEPHGIELVDAPVSGGPQWAEAGKIAIMVGASDAQFAKIEPILKKISVNVLHCGGSGNGHVAKTCNNLMAASQRLLAFEVIGLAARNGLPPEKAVEVLNKGSGRSYTLEVTFPRHILSGDNLDQGFALGLMLKDVKLANQLAIGSDVPLFLGGMVQEYYKAIVKEIGATADVNRTVHFFERQAGAEIARPPSKANAAA
ncbi:3-hydroxyisobutyrate dehydrogenase [Rhodoligotrophos appendicifer]|nr:NAD(P)-dependent oxidoreductase [Rhodoligotrophos appendicifer]